MWLEIKQNLMELPKKIMEKEEEIYELKKQCQERELLKDIIKDGVNEPILQDKETYTNDKSRSLELNKRLKKAEDYQKALEDIKEKKDKIAKEERLLSFLVRTNQNCNSLVSGFTR